MACLSKLRRTFEPSLRRGWHHRADGLFVSKKGKRSSRKQRLLSAAFFGFHKRLKVLLKTRAVNDKGWVDEALVKAARRRESECVKVLIAAKASVDHQDRNGLTALMNAAAIGDIECFKILINANADVNIQDKQGWTALIHAKPDCIELLIESGTNVNH